LGEKLFWKDPGGILLNCLTEEETEGIIIEFHKGVCGGHHAWRATTYKILRAGYYWPSLFSDVNSMVRACVECHMFVGNQKLFPLPLRPIKVETPFQQWGLDFIGEINPNSSGQHKWILTATNYFTKWVESIPTRETTDTIIIKFLEENILARFGCPRKIIIDNSQAFKSSKMVQFCQNYNIELGHSTTYYPQGNGLVESSNKNLIRIIKKMLSQNKKAWDSHLKYVVWEDRVSIKISIGTSPFQLVYGLEAIFPIQLILPVMKLLQDEEEKSDDM
jgi:hypothetical protein